MYSQICVHHFRGKCKFGESCVKRHDGVCEPFVKFGVCKYGDRCSYGVSGHPPEFARKERTKSAAPPGKNQAKKEVNEFKEPSGNLDPSIKQFLIVVMKEEKKNKLVTYSRNYHHWINDWKTTVTTLGGSEALLSMNVNYVRPLLVLFSLLPLSAANIPNLSCLFSLFCEEIANIKALSDLDFLNEFTRTRLLALDFAELSDSQFNLNVLQLLKQKCISIEKCTAKVMTQLMSTNSSALLEINKKFSPFLEQIQEFSEKLQSIQPSFFLEKSVQQVQFKEGVGNDSSMDRWYQNPTVGWLVDVSSNCWFQNVELQAKYDDSSEYTSTLQRFWLYLAFYWGRGAFWPKCKHQENKDKVCNQPLFINSSLFKTHNPRCGCCHQVPTWKCSFPHHNYGLCDRCVQGKLENSLCGKIQTNRTAGREMKDLPTDVYDATVVGRRVYDNDSLFLNLTGLLSRKPPEKVSWKTTYRLQDSCLVGIVPLSVANGNISKDGRIYLAEVHFLKESRIEYQERSKGWLTLRLISKVDCDLFQNKMQIPFLDGSKVAIIDFRVFVPEVLSVLSILFQPEFKKALNRLPFKDILLGYSSPRALQINTISRNDAITSSVMNSTIPSLKDLQQEIKELICKEICSLRSVQTLDTTQLDAFCKGLSISFHCTQGPPGTGKSYVGVCLLLALGIIRRQLHLRGSSVGPVVVLSYKNHALDEFLLDILKDNEFKIGELIRIGKSTHDELRPYKEFTSKNEKTLLALLKEQLKTFHAFREFLKLVSSWEKENYPTSSPFLPKFLKSIFFLHKKIQSCFLENRFLSPEESFLFCQSFLDNSSAGEESDFSAFSLVQDVLHWKFPFDYKHRSINIYKKWLDGEMPPPRCQEIQAGNQCSNCSKQIGNIFANFCSDFHCCTVEDCGERKEYNQSFCLKHLCSFPSCSKKKNATNVPYCADHLCPFCSDCPKTEEHEACFQHTCAFSNCRRSQLVPLPFCISHMCVACLDEETFENDSVKHLGNFCLRHECTIELCSANRIFGSAFCYDHTCRSCLSASEESSNYCLHHLCSYQRCKLPKAVTKKSSLISAFCIEHTCRVCVQYEKSSFNSVFLEAETCSEHPLCSHIDGNGVHCLNLLDQSKHPLYCPKHVVNVENNCKQSDIQQCNGITKKGKRCQSKCKSGALYCKDHFVADPALLCLPTAEDLFTNGCDRLISEKDFPTFDRDRFDCNSGKIRFCHDHSCKAACLNLEWKCIIHNTDFPTVYIANEASKEAEVEVDRQLPSTTIVTAAKVQVKEVKYNPEFEDKEDVNAIVDDLNGRIDQDELEDIPAENISGKVVNTSNVERIITSEDDPESEEENDDRLHNKQLFEEEVEDAVEEVNNYYEKIDFTFDEETMGELDLQSCFATLDTFTQWSWQMNNNQRVLKFREVFECMYYVLLHVAIQADLFIDETRQAKAVANASVFRSASIIGSTVVGAAKRLKAFRGAEPFAIIVEEACEVMEPTLAAVLCVNGLQKLELIGDQRQLPAFVQNCWFNVEMNNRSIKKSLFERLIENSKDCTVLDIQRRMRSSISALTKEHYADVIQIIDDPKTATQKIGDKSFLSSINLFCLNSWTSKGRRIPGCQSPIYFWNMLENTESRPTVGLSACNENEADAIIKFVHFLVGSCGVPESSITVITPYKGQSKILYRSLNPRNSNKSDPSSIKLSEVVISTVDQYQGDENDIVILSLVKSKPGNRFVKFLNRFIVACSRARLGFYIIGSAEAVYEGFRENEPISLSGNKKDDHWKTFLHHLQVPLSSPDNEFQYPRVSSYLPICCPQHTSSQMNISSLSNERVFPNSLSWNSFCHEPCTFAFQCGHRCLQPCHAPTFRTHEKTNVNCLRKLKNPCEIHQSQSIICKDLKLQSEETSVGALRRFVCKIGVDVNYETCAHSYQIPCNIQKMMDSGKSTTFIIPQCEKAVQNYIPQCGHPITNLKCFQLQSYLKSPPKCQQIIQQKRLRCSHQVSARCHSISEELQKSCKEIVSISLPRCGHAFNSSCFSARNLKKLWNLYSDKFVDDFSTIPVISIVVESAPYPMSEVQVSSLPNHLRRITISACMNETTFERNCGHKLHNIPCSLAFQYAKHEVALPNCEERVSARCKICSRPLTVPCYLSDEYEQWSPFLPYSTKISLSNTNFSHNSFYIDEEQISNIRKENSSKSDQELWKVLQSQCKLGEVYFYRECTHLATLTCEQAINLFLDENTAIRKCKQPAQRDLSCGHSIKVPCYKSHRMPPPVCLEKPLEDYTFTNCSHTIKAPSCYELSEWKRLKFQDCHQIIRVKLPRCGHFSNIECRYKAKVTNQFLIEGNRCLPNPNTQVITVLEKDTYCLPCLETPTCTETSVEFQRLCGHTIMKVACDDAFAWTVDFRKRYPPPCSDLVSLKNPLCNHMLAVECSVSESLIKWKPWKDYAIPPKFQIGDRGKRFLTLSQLKELPLMHSLTVDPAKITCNEEVYLQCPDCFHLQHFQCTDLFKFYRDFFCTQTFDDTCKECSEVLSYHCYEFFHMTPQEKALHCQKIVPKRCIECQYNSISVPCSEKFPKCCSLVQTTLPCGHDVTWECGKEEDIRVYHNLFTGKNPHCLECNTLQWRTINEEKVLDLSVFQDYCLKEFQRLFPEICFNDEVNALNTITYLSTNELVLNAHESAKSEIIHRLIQAFETKELNSFPPVQSNESYWKQYYKVVFTIIDDETPEELQHLLWSDCKKLTPYGTGLTLKKLTRHALFSSKKGFQILVGVAFHINKVCSDHVRPFSSINFNDQKQVINSETKKLINQQKEKYKRAGYDYVQLETSPSNIEYIFWQPKIAFPVIRLQLSQATCGLCFDHYLNTAYYGMECSNCESHFLCWDCVGNTLEQINLKSEFSKSFVNDEGNLLCQECYQLPAKRQTVYDYASYMNGEKSHPTIMQQLFETKYRYISQIQITAIEKQTQERITNEINEFMRKNALEQECIQLKRYIQDEIFIYHCPNPVCKVPIQDEFDACFHVTCTNESCRRQFCAWCLQLNVDARHVANCQFNPRRDVFGSIPELLTHRRKERLEKVQVLMKGKSNEVKRRIKEMMKNEFRSMGIEMSF